MVTPEQLVTTLGLWVEEVVLPKTQSSIKKMAIAFAYLQYKDNLTSIIQQYSNFLGSTSDEKKLQENLLIALDKAGGRVTIPHIDWILDRDDVIQFFNILNTKVLTNSTN